MIEIAVPLKDQGAKRNLGELIREAAEKLRGEYDPRSHMFRLMELKAGRERILLRYEVNTIGIKEEDN